jgi:hypothetical protein
MFTRNHSQRWHDDVPGSRWFRADLHVHTLDDHPNTRLTRPAGIGDPTDQASIDAYARAFLQAAVANRVEVVGLTPHAPCAGREDRTSVVWRIVEVWNNDADDDGIPFRDKIYAVFPGLEPSLQDGADGLHLLFLFDPEIERDVYMGACALMMGAVTPYAGNRLQISQVDSATVFSSLSDLRNRGQRRWDFVCLAAHAFSQKGLFALKAQVLENFHHSFIQALELPDDSLPEDELSKRPYLADGMRKYRHAFFHSSDAYQVGDIGRRFTSLKLASPRIESIRQAFLAADSRLRIVYTKSAAGKMQVRADLPEASPATRPWLHSVTITGGTSFFAGCDIQGQSRSMTIRFSPDLTCVIGGRMTGKSSLLDGLRVFGKYAMPQEQALATDVQDRGEKRFLSGGANLSVIARGPVNTVAAFAQQWPASFFAQRELQRIAKDQSTRRYILYRLLPNEAGGLLQRDDRLGHLDDLLEQSYVKLKRLHAARVEAETKLQTTSAAKEQYARVQAAGIQDLAVAQADCGRLKGLNTAVTEVDASLPTDGDVAAKLKLPTIGNVDVVKTLNGDEPDGFRTLVTQFLGCLAQQHAILNTMKDRISAASQVATLKADQTRAKVQDALIRSGGTAEELNRFADLMKVVSEFEPAQERLRLATEAYRQELKQFAGFHRERLQLIGQQRTTMKAVIDTITSRSNGAIRVTSEEGGVTEPLGQWLTAFKNAHLTRWWNDVRQQGMHPERMRTAVRKADCLVRDLGMSTAVADSFMKAVGPLQRMELASLRSEDRYDIEMCMTAPNGATVYRSLERLSGGAQVTMLLSLLLDTEDSTPLVVDQPEDEADKDYLLTFLIPALRRLKGKRQVIFATHDANIVVNGDADQVVFLRADADHVTESVQGAIDEPRVRDAVIETLDGGRDAFSLRQAKYGF